MNFFNFKFHILLKLLLFSFLNIVIAETNLSEIQNILPAYAIAWNAHILPKSSKCRQQLNLFKDSIHKKEAWSLRMLDSSGQPRTGFTHGNNYWIGSKYQCYDTMNEDQLVLSPKWRKHEIGELGRESAPYQLHYFTAHLLHNSTVRNQHGIRGEDIITLGLCLPATCNLEELELILKKIIEEKNLVIERLYTMDLKLLYVKNSTHNYEYLSDWHIIVTGCIIIATLLTTIVATFYDICIHQKQLNKKYSTETEKYEKFISILLCFSAHKNSKDLFKITKDEDSIESLNGMRVLGIIWMILLHILFFARDYIDNKTFTIRFAISFLGQIIGNGSLSVDTFFFLGGFLSTYTFFKNSNNNKNRTKDIQWKIFFNRIVKRFIRLTPPYLIVIGIAEIVYGYYEKVSHLYITENSYETCPKYWWRNLFYINNLFKRSEMCIYWSYYLSNDMQFFIIGSFLLFLSTRFRRTAFTICCTIFLSSIIFSVYRFYIFEYLPTIDEQINTMDIFYDPPWMRIGPYLIGMMTGFMLVTMKQKFQFKKNILLFLWSFGISCNLIALFGAFDSNRSLLSSSIFMGLHRNIWVIGIAWIVIACCTKQAGIINTILSWKFWQPLSKLSYCVNLFNPLIINMFFLSIESTFHVDIALVVIIFIGILIVSFFCGYIMSLLFEMPYVSLIKLSADLKKKKTK